MMPSATSGNFRPSRRFACDRCRSFKLRCQRDEALGEACERCAKTNLPCTTTFEHTSQRQSLANRLNHNHNHQQNVNVIEKEGRGENRPAAVTEAHPSPPRDDGHGRFDSNQGQPPRRSSSPPDRHDEPNGAAWNPLPSPAVENRPRPASGASKEQLTTSETNGLARHWADAGERMLLDHNSLVWL